MKQKSVNPSVWGSSGWHILHRMSFWFDSAPVAHEFYKTLVRLLPCPKCRMAYAQHISNIKFPTKKTEIPMWVYQLHNSVNNITGKDTYVMTLTELRKMYASPNDDEWIFIASMVESHPGQNAIDDEYLHDLEVFMKHWTMSASITYPGKNVLRSKIKLRTWIRQHHHVFKMKTCCSDYCEI